MYKKLFLVCLLGLSFVSAAHHKVHMSDINALTFNAGYKTRSRRGESYPQMILDGHTPRGIKKFSASSIQCYQEAYNSFNGESHWKCVADLPRGVKLGAYHISCEGYDYPGDSYVLDGSCSIKYRLERSHGTHKYGSSFSTTPVKRQFDLFEMLFVVFLVVVVLVTVKGCSMYHDTTPSGLATAAVGFAVGRATAPRLRFGTQRYREPIADTISPDTERSTSYGTGSSR